MAKAKAQLSITPLDDGEPIICAMPGDELVVVHVTKDQKLFTVAKPSNPNFTFYAMAHQLELD